MICLMDKKPDFNLNSDNSHKCLIKIKIMNILAILSIFGGIPAMILWGFIAKLKIRRHQIDKQSELIAMAIEKGENVDSKRVTEIFSAFNVEKKSTKRKVLKHLEYGALSSLVGVFILIYGLCKQKNDPIMIGGLLLTIGIAFLIMFFVSKRFLQEEIEKEEKEVVEKE